MPLYELNQQGELLPFRRLHGGAELYEADIEKLLWDNLDEITGESLFPVARQAQVVGGGKPDIIALDQDGRVVVIEVKRDVDRGQLAQCLEYAGWARTTSLDELSGLYHLGREAFFRDWQEFTGSATPAVINRSPRLILVARDFHGRTASALDYLIEHGLPVQLVPVTVYEDHTGRRLVDVEGDREPILPVALSTDAGQSGTSDRSGVDGRKIRMSDLVEAGLLAAGDELVWERPRLGQRHRAVVTDGGGLRLEDGREFSSPSRAAITAAGLGAYDGWNAWRVTRKGGLLLNELRRQLVANQSEGPDAAISSDEC